MPISEMLELARKMEWHDRSIKRDSREWKVIIEALRIAGKGDAMQILNSPHGT